MNLFKKIYAGSVYLFLYAPIVVLIVFSFNDSKSRGSWDGFTLRWYVELFHNSEILNALYYTISIAVLASLLATIIGTVAALAIYYHMKPFQKNIVMNLTYLPVLNPDIVTGISLMLLFIFVKFE